MIPDVSIIVPCYNVAAYVDSCLDSLVRQTLRNIEIICINDGSTDETWIHLLRWKEKDSRIILLNQRNAGVSAARNAGLDAARGLYVGFADPDDYMDPEMYSRLFSAALEYDADIVECGNHVFEDSSDRLIEAKRRSPSRHFEENASPASFFRDSIWGKMDICVWSKLFRKSMLDAHRLRFNVHLKSGAEDETFRLMAVPHASRLLFIPDCLYYYRLMRNGSLSRRCNVPTYSKCVQEFQRLLYIVDYWQKQGWQNEGLFAYGVRKIRPFFVSKHPLFHQMTAVQQRSALNLWKLFYQKKRGLPLPQHKRRIHYGHEQAGRALQRGGHFPEPHASGCPFQRSAGIHGLQNPFRYLPDGRSSGSGSGRKDGAGRSAGDLNQMAAHCERLIQDGKLLQTLAEEGRRHAEQTFSYPVIAARHAALYEETLREYRYEE